MIGMRRMGLAVATLGLLVLGADEPTQEIRAGGVTFSVPKSWKVEKPSSQMRVSQLKISPEKGDDEPAEFYVVALRGGGGGVEGNLARWQKMFEGEGGKPAEIKSEKRKTKDGEVTFAEISGHYVAAVMPGRPEKHDKANWRMLGGIVLTEDTGYFFRLVGPDKTVKAAKPAFEAMLKTISAGE